jgi:hypothetical protein
MHATDMVGINGITRVLLVYTRQQGVYRLGHVLPVQLPPMFLPIQNGAMKKSTEEYQGLCNMKGVL